MLKVGTVPLVLGEVVPVLLILGVLVLLGTLLVYVIMYVMYMHAHIYNANLFHVLISLELRE